MKQLRLLVILWLGWLTCSCGTSPPQPIPPTIVPGGIQFSLFMPDAQSVAVAGNFNDWSSTVHSLIRSQNGVWTGTIPLPPGEHFFMYVVDGEQWVIPPLADDFIPDGFGQLNGVMIVR